MVRKAWILVAVAACGGKVSSTVPLEDGTGASTASGNASQTSAQPAPAAAKPLPPGAIGLTPCDPLAVPSSSRATKLHDIVVQGESWNTIAYVVDSDPSVPGIAGTRAFIQRSQSLEQHAVSAGPTAGSYVIDFGMPNAVLITPTTLRGAGADGPLRPLASDLSALLTPTLDATEALAFADLGTATDSDPTRLFVLAPVIGGTLQTPRVFYGAMDKLQERRFISFTPSPPDATHFFATAVTFELDGAVVTMPTVDTHDTAGLIDGFSSAGTFFCY